MKWSISFVKKWTKNFATGGLTEAYDFEILRRVVIIYIISYVGISTLIPLTLLALVQGNTAVGLFNISVSTTLIVNVIYLRKGGRHDVACYVGVSAAGSLFLYLFVSEGPNNTGFLWYFTFLLFSCLLLGFKGGTISTLILGQACI